MHFRFLAVLIGTFLLLTAFQNCSDVTFSDAPNASDQCSENPEDVCHLATETIQKIQPAVAVRGISCLMCHAEVRANIITDFGYGSDWYFGGASANINSPSWYNNYVNTWQSARAVIGSAIVPDQLVPTNIQNSVTAFASEPPMKIKDFMNRPYDAPGNWGNNTAEQGRTEMSYTFAPAQGEKVIAKSQIVITSPSEGEIQNLAPSLWMKDTIADFQRMNSKIATQLKIVDSNGSQYVTNLADEALDCNQSNIVIKGTLFLKNLNVSATNGCRLYVSGSVFIEGPITYTGTSLQSLQITSANGIFMGININHLENRLLRDARGLQIDGPKSYSQRANQAVAEARTIGNLRDAKDDATNGSRDAIDFTGLLLNAPMIHSRYLGRFKGVIVAQTALFALGEFHFDFDPVYTSVNVFPLLKKPILVAK